jgi:hypothetical protein
LTVLLETIKAALGCGREDAKEVSSLYGFCSGGLSLSTYHGAVIVDLA